MGGCKEDMGEGHFKRGRRKMKEMTKSTIQELLEQRKWSTLREAIVDIPGPDLADMLLSLNQSERVLLFSLLPRQLSSEVFADLAPNDKDDLLKGLTDEETRQLLADLPPDDRTTLLAELPGQVTQRLLNLLSPEDLKEARLLLGFPEESVGRLMTPDYVAVRPHWTISRALDHIREKGKDSETISVIYVIDEDWHLLDALEIQLFILADPNDTVEKIMDYTFVSLSAYDDREEAVRIMDRYNLSALPVIDQDGVLLGIVTVDDVLDVAREEATEDFQKSAAVSPLRISYREASVWSLYRKRIGWLLALVFVNLISSGIIAAYEEVLAASIALAFFIPLLIDTGGNTGAQSASLMIRSLATEDIELSDWLRTLGKELVEGIFLGVTMGVAAWVLGYWRGGVEVAFIVGLTMLSLVIIANLVGVGLPFLLTRLRLDPAVASSPLITTVVDAVGLLIYFSIATWILPT
jgi:magnesium transporter